MNKSVLAILEEIKELNPQTLRGPETLLSLNLDSLDIVTLIVEIDTAFGVTISPAQFDRCECVADLAALVEREKGPRSAAA